MLTDPDRTASIAIAGACCLLLAMAGAGCASRRIAPVQAPTRPLRAATLEEVVAAYDGYCSGLDTLSAKGDAEVRDLRAGKARRIGVRVLAGRGGRLYIKGSVAVVTALEVIADGRRFWFRIPSRKTVWTGSAEAAPAGAEDEHAPYYALRPQDVVAALLPEPLAAGKGQALVLEADLESFAVTEARLAAGAQGVTRRRVFLARESLEPLRTRSYDEKGELVSEFTFGGFEAGLPHRVKVARPREGYEAEFFLDDVQKNAPLPARAFEERPAEGYKVVEVGAGR
jgi:outer membrane lipoprotein-sorting protein